MHPCMHFRIAHLMGHESRESIRMLSNDILFLIVHLGMVKLDIQTDASFYSVSPVGFPLTDRNVISCFQSLLHVPPPCCDKMFNVNSEKHTRWPSLRRMASFTVPAPSLRSRTQRVRRRMKQAMRPAPAVPPANQVDRVAPSRGPGIFCCCQGTEPRHFCVYSERNELD